MGPPVSARKLGATLWKMQLVVGPENDVNVKKENEDRLGFKVCFNSLFETQDLNFNFSKVWLFFVVLLLKRCLIFFLGGKI